MIIFEIPNWSWILAAWYIGGAVIMTLVLFLPLLLAPREKKGESR